MKGKVFEKKVIRESFLQEVLNAQVLSNYSLALEVYINNNGMTVLIGEAKKKAAEVQKLENAIKNNKYTFDDLRKLEKY